MGIIRKKITTSKFLMGEKETKNGFKAVFPWLIKEETVDAILSDSYGVGDRKSDVENLEKNIKIQESEVKKQFKEKIYDQLGDKLNSETEQIDFKKYLMDKEFEKDADRYSVKKHMDKIGRYYTYGGYITPSHVFYPGNEKYKNRLFKSYLMSKYYGIDEITLEKRFSVASSQGKDRKKVFDMLKSFKDNLRDFPCYFLSKTQLITTKLL